MEDNELVFILVFSGILFVLYLWLEIKSIKSGKERLKEDLEREREWRKKILENQIEEKERREFYKNRTERTKAVIFISKENGIGKEKVTK